MLKIQTAKILEKEMDRKVFLKNAGFAFAGLVGLTAVVKSIHVLGGANPASQSSGSTGYGYGATAYGGKQ